MAHTGTLFLDEIGDLPLALQPKLLRVLQEQEFERLGGCRTHRINVRLVAATHRDLAHMVARNEFRNDLYYRLNVFPVLVPPLRERRDDIRQLVLHFVELFSRRMGKQIEQIPQTTIDAFSVCDWPGNVRELQNLVERAVIRSNDGVLPNPLSTSQAARGSVLKLAADLPPIEESGRRIELGAMPELESTDSLENIQRRHILRVLKRTGWVISGPNGAGAILNLHPNTLRSLMNRLGIRRATHAVS
jgi:formate hydrogenlyase transcriptional activator